MINIRKPRSKILCLLYLLFLFCVPYQVIVYVSTVAGDLSIGLVRVAGIMVGVVVSLLCSLCVYPLSAESCLNEVGIYWSW